MEYYSHGYSSIRETLDIVERGLRRLGITGDGLRVQQIDPMPREDRPQQREITPAMIGEMIRMHGLDLSQAEIARQLGCSQGAVSKHLRRLGYIGTPGFRRGKDHFRNRQRTRELQVA